MTFSVFDILVLIILFSSSVLGFYRGMITITINLLGFIASIIVAIFFYSYLSELFSQYIANQLAASIISGLTSYITSLIILTFFTSKILLLFHGVSRGLLDRISGLIIGVIRGFLFVLIIFAIVAIFVSGIYSKVEKNEDLINKLSSEDYPIWLKDSVTTPYLEESLKSLILFIPSEILNSIKILNPPKKDEDIIDEINARKNKADQYIEDFLDKESDTQALSPEK